MLKIVKTSIAVVALSFIFAGNANANVNAALENICNIVKANDKGELRKKMKKVQSDYKLKLKDYYDAISCGDDSLIRAAIKANAVDAGTLLVKKMPKSQLSAPEKDGKTLQAWVSENGLSSSPIAEVLNARI